MDNLNDMCIALSALGPLRLHFISSKENWCASLEGVEIGGGNLLRSATTFDATPSGAIVSLWRMLSDLPTDQYVVVRAYSPDRQQYRWRKVLWAPVPVEGVPA